MQWGRDGRPREQRTSRNLLVGVVTNQVTSPYLSEMRGGAKVVNTALEVPHAKLWGWRDEKKMKKWGCKYNLHDFELRCCTFNRLQSRTWFERVACAVIRRLPFQAACRLAGGACGESSVSVWAKGDLCSCIAVAQLFNVRKANISALNHAGDDRCSAAHT